MSRQTTSRPLAFPYSWAEPFHRKRAKRSAFIILSQAAVEQLWPGQNPIGRSIRLGATDEQFHNRSEWIADGLAYQVVGVVRDTRGVELNGSASRRLCLPLTEERLQNHPILI